MTPSLPDILTGFAVALSTPLPPEASGDYAAGRAGILTLIALLAAQEAERGIAARLWENGAIRSLFSTAAPAYDGRLGGRLGVAAAGADDDLSWTALDLANANLRRLLIVLHEAAENNRDAGLDSEILGLYRRMAHERRLELPSGVGA
ncbi:MAG: hypothetical protein M3T55_07630 [Pseudomonadota bacterium]|nr:hypothetical protein [Pseudomonadota bacterium]